MHLTKSQNGHDLTSENYYITEADKPDFKIIKRPRIGVDYAKHWAKRLLRFYIKDNRFVSKK
jgi:DNA-3-methyladenine glycosylase